jgi:hypothetical protein
MFRPSYGILLFLVFVNFSVPIAAWPSVLQDGDRTYIVDQTGERWEVTQAESIGFEPERFQYGIGRNAFVPLDGSDLRKDTFFVHNDLPVIGLAHGKEAQAYSIPKLSRHEIANTVKGSEAIAVGY